MALRSWLQFRLRTMFVAITLIGAILGVAVRIRYLQGRVEFHRLQSFPTNLAIIISPGDPSEAEMWAGLEAQERRRQRHEDLANAFERAVWRPWTYVDETMPHEDTKK